MGSGLVNAWRRLEDFDFGSLSYPELRGGHRNRSIFFPVVLRRGLTGSTIDPRLDLLNTVEKINLDNRFSAVSMMSVLLS